jgi:hypothetical protein
MAFNLTQRPEFYEEQYLGAADLSAAVDYGRLQQARHALGAHTWGIALGLQLKETPQPGGTVTVHLLPGYAFDGYGRPIVVLAPYKIPEEKFSAIKFDATIDTDGRGRLIEIWLRYDELAAQPPRPGFEVCDVADQRSRIQETFRIEISEQPLGVTDRYSGITVAAKALEDAKKALQAFASEAPIVYDESIPHQALPEPQERARWLIPIGYVRWLPVQNQSGHFVARDDSGAGGAEKDSDKIRGVRRYIGVVAEEIEAADRVIRLRDRGKDPAANFQWPTQDQLTNETNDLVWVEGNLRVIGNVKLCAGKLNFRDQEGKDFDVPLTIQRKDGAGTGALEVAIGPKAQTGNRFAVGPLDGANVEEKFVVLSGGNVGIGILNPSQLLTLGAPEGTKLEIARTSATLPWSQASGDINEGAFVINQQSKGSSKPGADFALMRDRKKRLALGTADTYLSSQEGGHLRFYVNLEEPPGELEVMRITGSGNVGIGTTNPGFKMDVSDRMRVRQGNSESAGIWFFQEGPNNNRAFVGMADDNSVGFYGNAGAGWGLVMDTTTGNVGIGTEASSNKLEVDGSLQISGAARRPGGGSWTDSSDLRLKKEVAPLTEALGKLLQLRGVRFEWKEPEKMGNLTGPQMGLIAQEVETVFPEWVGTRPDGYKEVTIRGFEALTIEALRELQVEIEELKARFDKSSEQKPTAARPKKKKTSKEKRR